MDATAWFRARGSGSRSGRAAWRYIRHIAGQQEKQLS